MKSRSKNRQKKIKENNFRQELTDGCTNFNKGQTSQKKNIKERQKLTLIRAAGCVYDFQNFEQV
jgi:hypothetical protein